MSTKWKVVPLSFGQLQDVREEDILEGGLYRKCETYRGGGGYDQFPAICETRLELSDVHQQFIVQLRGCNLDCPYCYVTREGVWGEPTLVSTEELLNAFERSGQRVFHLMGGAPALFLNQWPDLVERFTARFPDGVFHSDLMLTEKLYNKDTLRKLASYPRSLYAVDVKGLDEEEHQRNTRKPFRDDLFWKNLSAIVETRVPFYITFTNISPSNQQKFWNRFMGMYFLEASKQWVDAFSIDLIDYDALPFVDTVEWGGKTKSVTP